MIIQTLIYQKSNFNESEGISRLVLVGATTPSWSSEMDDIYDLLAIKNGKRKESLINCPNQKPSFDHSSKSITGSN